MTTHMWDLHLTSHMWVVIQYFLDDILNLKICTKIANPPCQPRLDDVNAINYGISPRLESNLKSRQILAFREMGEAPQRV